MLSIATHNGSFHTDDIFAVATLKLYLAAQGEEEVEIIRTRDAQTIIDCDYVLDVGGVYDPEAGRFDHHQKEGAGERDNGIPYAAFGLVWKEYGEDIVSSAEIAKKIDQRLVQAIDGPDNGVSLSGEAEFDDVYPYYLGTAVNVFRPTWKEPSVREDETFLKLVEWATVLLEREITVARDVAEGEQLVEAAYEQAADKRVIYMDQQLPWQGVLVQKEEPLFVVYPKDSGHWRLRGVPAEENFVSRAELPEDWRGKRDQDLVAATGVDSAIFCHKSLPMIVATEKEGIDTLAQKALENL